MPTRAHTHTRARAGRCTYAQQLDGECQSALSQCHETMRTPARNVSACLRNRSVQRETPDVHTRTTACARTTRSSSSVMSLKMACSERPSAVSLGTNTAGTEIVRRLTSAVVELCFASCGSVDVLVLLPDDGFVVVVVVDDAVAAVDRGDVLPAPLFVTGSSELESSPSSSSSSLSLSPSSSSFLAGTTAAVFFSAAARLGASVAFALSNTAVIAFVFTAGISSESESLAFALADADFDDDLLLLVVVEDDAAAAGFFLSARSSSFASPLSSSSSTRSAFFAGLLELGVAARGGVFDCCYCIKPSSTQKFSPLIVDWSQNPSKSSSLQLLAPVSLASLCWRCRQSSCCSSRQRLPPQLLSLSSNSQRNLAVC
jgi:hypothetical protein